MGTSNDPAGSDPDAQVFSGPGVTVVKRLDRKEWKLPALVYEIGLEREETQEVLIEDPILAHLSDGSQDETDDGRWDGIGLHETQEEWWIKDLEQGTIRFNRTVPAENDQFRTFVAVKGDGAPQAAAVTPTVRVDGETVPPVDSETPQDATDTPAQSSEQSGGDTTDPSGAPDPPGVDGGSSSEASGSPDVNQSDATSDSARHGEQDGHSTDTPDGQPAADTQESAPSSTDADPASAADADPAPHQDRRRHGPPTTDEEPSHTASDIEASADRAERAAEEAREAAAAAKRSTEAAMETADKVETLVDAAGGAGSGGSVLNRLLTELAEADDQQVAALREQLGLDDVADLSNNDMVHIDHLATKVSEMEAYIDDMAAFLDENGSGQDAIQSVQRQQANLRDDVESLEAEIDSTAGELESDLDNLRSTLAEMNEEIEMIQQLPTIEALMDDDAAGDS